MSARLRSAGGVTLIGGGALCRADLDWARQHAPCIVAADGGGDAALDLGVMPDAVIGDLDSLSAGARARLAGRIHRIAEQDSTDFAKALRLTEAPFFLALGFTGRRLDHTLAALSVLVRAPRPVLMLAEEDVIFRAPKSLRLELPPGCRVSLYPMGLVSGRSTGLQWPIDGLDLSPAARVGTSNAALGPVELTHDGPLLVLLPRDQAGAALAGLGIAPGRGGAADAPPKGA